MDCIKVPFDGDTDCSYVINDNNKRVNFSTLFADLGEGLYAIGTEATNTYGLAIAYVYNGGFRIISGIDSSFKSISLAIDNYYLPSLDSKIIAVNFVRKI